MSDVDRAEPSGRAGAEPAPLPASLVRAAAYSWRLIVIGVVVVAALTIVGKIVPVLVAIFIAAFLASVLHPAAARLSRYMPRWLSVTLVLVLFVALVAGAVAFISASVAGEWKHLSDAIQNGIIDLEHWLRTGPLHLSQADLTHLVKTVESWVTSRSGSLLHTLVSSAGSIFDVVTALLTGIFALIFFLSQPRRMFDWALSWTPTRMRLRVDEASTLGWNAFSEYTRGIILVAISDSVVVAIGLAIIGVPLVGPLALLVFFGAFIPIIGAPIAMIIAALVALAAKGWVAALLVIALIFVVGELEGHVFQPLILGRVVALHPLAIVLLVAIGTTLAGFVGALVAVPVGLVFYTVLKYLTDRIPEHPRAPFYAVDEAYESELEAEQQREANRRRIVRPRKPADPQK